MIDAYDKESEQIMGRSRGETMTISVMMLTSNFILLSCFIFVIHVSSHGVINPEKAFALISAFFILQNPMREFSKYMIQRSEAK